MIVIRVCRILDDENGIDTLRSLGKKMVRICTLLCFLALFPLSVAASCLFDYNRLGSFIFNGDWEGAEKFVDSYRANKECECDSEEKPCLRMGDIGSDIVSVNKLSIGIVKLRELDIKLIQDCSKMEQADDTLRQIKQDCFEQRLRQFEKDNQQLPSIILENMTKRLFEKYSISAYKIVGNPEKATKEPKETAKTKSQIRSEEIAFEICELLEAEKKLLDRKNNVGRQPKKFKNMEYGKERKLAEEIRLVQERIQKLKQEFRALSQGSFYKLDWCKKKKKGFLEF